MLALAIAASLTTLPDAIDWSKASDDLRFASLKPVMTEAEVRRMMAGKERDYQACGSATNEDGETAPYCGAGYDYTLTGRAGLVFICFDLLGPAGKPKKQDDQWRDSGDRPWGGRLRAPKPVKWTIVGFKVEGGARYKRNKDGLFEVQK